MNLETKQKLSLSIGIVNTLAVGAVVSLFVFLFAVVSENNVRNDLMLEAEEIVTQHIAVEPDRLTYVTDGDQTTIEQDLLTDRLSAVIFSKDEALLGSFGYFQIKQNLINHNELLKNKATRVCEQKRYEYMVDNSDKERFELLFYPILSKGECRGVLVVAASMQSNLQLLQFSLYLAVAMIALVLIVNILFGQYIATFILRPLITVAQKMHEVSIDQQITALPTPPTKDELSQLIDAFNAMSARVNEGATKQKEFIANASHELKTPIARAMSDLDVALLHLEKKSQNDAKQSVEAARNDLSSLHTIIESLLVAARIKHTGFSKEPVNIEKIIDTELAKIKTEYKEKNLKVTQQIDVTSVIGDQRILEVILRNCLQNAAKYNIPNGSINILTATQSKKTTIQIQNTTSENHTGIDVVERFSRGNMNTAGYGLGLSIVKELCDIAGYELEITPEVKRFKVTMIIR